MSLLPVHRSHGSLLPDFTDLWNAFTPVGTLTPMFNFHTIRLEDALDDGHYTVRAEIPGIDPAEDLEVTVADGHLTIRAERSVQKEENGRSEFGYGSFVRTVALPPGAVEDGVDAEYAKGILTVTVPMTEAKPTAKKIEVKAGE
ncbi:Hsp20/alpha crystallin family protein [Nocardia bovistercoris]|uniref:Hsp20/alpha crystallin family protein n=1 Tax=Nocardia bovistercoris TaxID=2785916 RepID=A0A931IH97_9NOCA|nr:Hsp20/alpha crystallin family protein [Nocardia bovistercoris]MBH0781752.1 Hsp20/alpha crystallin family protein [Nocardia bovistercoris]